MIGLLLSVLFVGPPGPSFGPVPPAPAHARVWDTSREWDGSRLQVGVRIGPVAVERTRLLLYCSDSRGVVLSGETPWPSSVPQQGRARVLSVSRRPELAMPCTAVLGWVSDGGQVGYRWAVEAPVGRMKSAVAAASLNSLPYRVECNPNSGCLPAMSNGGAGLVVCLLAGQTPPVNRLYQTVNCPGETRSSVPSWEWCAAMRNVTAGIGVPFDRAEAIRRQTCPAN